MKTRFKQFPELEGAQALASDPKVHAALSASAGTGKTQVLTARVLRLLLQGARPDSILCLTFTKAAAAEMANRIGSRLANWVRLKDGDLKTDLVNLGERVTPPLVQRARQLFAKVLDAPGGLRIQTIHAFAQSLLAAFPAEAEIVPGFQPLEGRAEQELVRRTLADLLASAEECGDAVLIADVQALSRRLGEGRAVDYLQACARKAEAMAAFGSRDEVADKIRKIMELPENSVDDYLARQCSDEHFDCDLLRSIADANRGWNTSEGAGHIDQIERWLALPPDERANALPDLALVVFTKSNERRKSRPGQVKADPDYQARSDRLAEIIAELIAIQRGARLAEEMAAGIRAGQAFAAAYARAKRSAGVADFNDLIGWTRALLARPGMGDWVRYKLDRQIDHILVDEAQDTNAAQFDIIRPLAEELFTGSSETDERWRTLFAVGDHKQSIFGFQGSDPRQFRLFVDQFRSRADELRDSQDPDDPRQLAREFRDLSIAASYRSAQPILDVVDAVIADLGPQAMGLPDMPDLHRAHHSDRPGEVELWRPFEPEDSGDGGEEGEESWVGLSARLYADELAARIQALIDQAPMLASTGRKLAPGDVMVLVRSRKSLASLVVARLFARRVPVAGVDRLQLHEPLAVQDLLAAIRFAVQPGDDLSLASLLVSPLLGWDQDELRDLAYGRKHSLWRALRERAGESASFADAHATLGELLRIADFTPPSRFLETILTGPMQGRRKLYSRLGPASRDPIDELMNSALEFERDEIASLDRFLSWFSRGEVDVQRDPSTPANEVRVMTVHGAKGLEAPVVILADSTANPDKLGRTSPAFDFPVPGCGIAPLLRPKKQELCSPFEELIAEEKKLALEEHMRLLYVALTRASDRLIVAGLAPPPKQDGSDPRPANCWHVRVEAALTALDAERMDDGTLVYRRGGIVRPRADKRRAEALPVRLPDWALKPAPPEALPPRPLAPSALTEDREAALPPSAAMRVAAERGTLIHALLERLPPVAPERRRAAALRWLEQSAGLADRALRESIAEMVCVLLGDERFAELFGPGSLAEAPIAATLADGRVVAGTVDRLLIEPDRVRVIDYKTGRAPASEADIPTAHRLQMDAYVQALAVIFPGRAINAALLYTASATLFELAP